MINNKQRLFEMMDRVGGMPLKEFNIEKREAEYRNLINFIGKANEYSSYLHTTNTEENAKSICQLGFQFETFEKSTDIINNDIINLIYKLGIRIAYGNFTIIIQIKRNVYPKSVSTEYTDENGEEMYILPPQYIKGYYNRITKEVFENPLFKQ